jgi:TP901 family phage tail tape measure protein
VSRASSAQLDLIAKDAQFQKVAGRVKRTMLQVRDGMERVSRAARRVFLIGTGAISAVALTGASFEKRMARVAAITQATEREMMELTATAREMGKSTVFSANQAAEAMGFFAQAGFETQKIMASLAPTLNLAAAGQLDIARAADLVTNIMSGMGIGVERLDATVDQLTKTFTSSNTSLEQLADAMKMVGPIASSAGMSLASTAASVGKLSDAGLQATMAGTGLRMILLQLQDPNTEGQMNALGVAVRDAAGNMLSFTTIIDNMSRALDRLDPRKQAELLGLFGARAGPALRVLLRIGGAELRKFAKEIENSGGIADKVAKTQLDTLHGSFLLLKSAAQEFALLLGETVVPIIRDLTDWVRGMIDRMNKWSKETGVAIAKTLLWTTGLAGLLAVGTAVSAMILSMGANLVTLGVTLVGVKAALLATFGNPIVLAITAAATAIGLVAIAAKDTADELEGQLDRITTASRRTGEAFRKLKDAREAGMEASAGGPTPYVQALLDQLQGDTSFLTTAERVALQQPGRTERSRAERQQFEGRVKAAENQIKRLRELLKEERRAQAELAEQELVISPFHERIARGRGAPPPLVDFEQRQAQLEASGRVQDKLNAKIIAQIRLIEQLKRERKEEGDVFAANLLREDELRRQAIASLKDMIRRQEHLAQVQAKAKRRGEIRDIVSERLKALKQQEDILAGRTTERELQLRALRNAGVAPEQMAEIEKRLARIDALRQGKAGQPSMIDQVQQLAVGGIEGLRETFRRMQTAALQPQDTTAKQNLQANQNTTSQIKMAVGVLQQILNDIGNLVPGFAP